MSDIRELIEWLGEHERALKERGASGHHCTCRSINRCACSGEFVYETSVVVLAKKRKKRSCSANKFDKATKEKRFKEEGGICQWCHLQILGRWHAHHIIPKSQGGGNEPKNLMVLHPECHLNPIAYEVLHPGMALPKAFNISRWRTV